MPLASRLAIGFTGFLVIMVPMTARAGDDSLPDGPGKVVLQRICSTCHAPEIVVGRHESKDRWDGIVSSMVEKGAVGTDDELNTIVDYLATNFGKKDDGSPKGDSKDTSPKK